MVPRTLLVYEKLAFYLIYVIFIKKYSEKIFNVL